MTWFSLVRGLEKGTDLHGPAIPPVDANIYAGEIKLLSHVFNLCIIFASSKKKGLVTEQVKTPFHYNFSAPKKPFFH